MAHKKNGFLNFCFSCIPGAGQMYQGFIKRGTSIMVLFCGAIMLIAYQSIDELSFILPVIWFYGFFDSIHRNSLPDSEFMQLRDDYLFINDDIGQVSLKKFRVPLALFLIFIGGYSLLRMFVHRLCWSGLLNYNSVLVEVVLDTLPRMVFSAVIIGVGVYLINGKTKETFGEASEEKTPGWNIENPEGGFQADDSSQDVPDEQIQEEEDGGEEE